MRPNALKHSSIAYRLDPHVRQVLSRLPEEVITKLSEEELLALYNSITGSPRSNSIDLRLSLPLVPKRLYFVTLLGLERRDIATRTPAKSPRNVVSVCLAMGISLIAGLAIGGVGLHVMSKGPKVAEAGEAKIYPVALPWIGDATYCEGKSRQWKDGLCYEQAHSPEF